MNKRENIAYINYQARSSILDEGPAFVKIISFSIAKMWAISFII